MSPASKVVVVRPSEWDLRPTRPEPDAPKVHVVADGRDGNPYVHISEVPAGFHIASHSHSESEVMVLLSGTTIVGGQEYGPGTILMIPADTKYAVDVGDTPLSFTVVRPRKAEYSGSQPPTVSL